MLTIAHCTKLIRGGKPALNEIRSISKYLDKNRMSKVVRQRFLDYFINDNNHHFVRSSPVVPYCDPTVAFVNAGMNQFKGIFLGNQSPSFKKVANSQKCVRVGGKHNDLNIVGSDGSHHTFFEMLGSWSFGDYFKKEACELAWNLLTDVYKINKRMLYVTYFNGDDKLGLKPDLECREIWKAIGVDEDRILPFGIQENFWEMGPVGPCGPCTEIHVDQRGFRNRAHFVNKGVHDLNEIWNIVFIQYNRNLDGTIEQLPKCHIDTGMGFERLCAVLQGKISNYDTDLFLPLFSAIQKMCKGIPKYDGAFGERDWNSLQTNYRILADHTRMITACLADGMIPEENQKLRRVMRKVFSMSESTFDKEGLAKELVNYVVEILGPVYLEMEKNIKQVKQIIDYEEELFKSLHSTSVTEWNNIVRHEPLLASLEIMEMPGLVSAYKDIKNNNVKEITDPFSFKLYDTYGLDEEAISKLSKALNIAFDENLLRNALERYKISSRMPGSYRTNDDLVKRLRQINLQPTIDYYKYKYVKKNNMYVFNNLSTKVMKIIKNNELVNEIEPNTDCSVIFDRTLIYCEAGGQISDKGHAVNNTGIFEIKEIENVDKILLHKGQFMSDNKLTVGDKLIMKVDEAYRLNNMRNHTATHLLNAALKSLKGVTCQKSSKVNSRYLNLDVGIFGEKLSLNDLRLLEDEINRVIKLGLDVKISEIDSQELLMSDNVTLIPGETYPDTGIRLVEIVGKDFLSREPCCGTHLYNTADVQDFCITNTKSLGRSTVSVHAVTGPAARQARNNATVIEDKITNLQISLNENIDKPEVFDTTMSSIRQNLNYSPDDDFVLPAVVKHECLERLNEINSQIKTASKDTLKEFIEMEMKSVLETKVCKTRQNNEYIIHYLRTSMILESVPLQKATKLCPDIPILVISYSDNMVKARCCVPRHLCTKDFNAQKWINQISIVFNSTAGAPKGQDPALVCNMKAKYVNIQEWDTLLSESLNLAKLYVEKHL